MEKAFGSDRDKSVGEAEKSIKKLREKVGEPVHERAWGRGLREYHQSQHGWARTRKGQHLDRALLADHQTRVHLPKSM